MAYGTNSSGNAGQVAIDRFAEMMIARMEQMKASDWKKGWIGGASGFAGLPQNVGGRNYSGSNSFFLQLQTAAQGYRLPVYLTFKQAHNLKAHVLKGEKAFPVVYWDVLVKDKNGHKVSSDEYKTMSKEEKKGMDVIPFFKAFPVYNIDQTNLTEVQPERVHSVEDKMLNYLSNAQGAMQNLYQIKRAGELVAKEIPQNCNLLLKSVGSNLKGTAIAAMVSDELADAATQMATLYPFMKQLVTSGKYDVTGADGKNEKHKVNLLNSSERYYIANEVVSRLEAINTDLFILAWQVRTLSWNDLWFSLDPEGWANVMSGKNIIGGIVAEWNQGYLLKW